MVNNGNTDANKSSRLVRLENFEQTLRVIAVLLLALCLQDVCFSSLMN